MSQWWPQPSSIFGVPPADRCVVPVSALQLDDVKRSRQTEDQSRTHPEVLKGIQIQLVSPPIKHRERCQQLKHLHLHHDVRRVQSWGTHRSHNYTAANRKITTQSGDEPTLDQGPDVASVLQDEVQTLGRVHDASDAGDAGQLQQSVSDSSTATAG